MVAAIWPATKRSRHSTSQSAQAPPPRLFSPALHPLPLCPHNFPLDTRHRGQDEPTPTQKSTKILQLDRVTTESSNGSKFHPFKNIRVLQLLEHKIPCKDCKGSISRRYLIPAVSLLASIKLSNAVHHYSQLSL